MDSALDAPAPQDAPLAQDAPIFPSNTTLPPAAPPPFDPNQAYPPPNPANPAPPINTPIQTFNSQTAPPPPSQQPTYYPYPTQPHPYPYFYAPPPHPPVQKARFVEAHCCLYVFGGLGLAVLIGPFAFLALCFESFFGEDGSGKKGFIVGICIWIGAVVVILVVLFFTLGWVWNVY